MTSQVDILYNEEIPIQKENDEICWDDYIIDKKNKFLKLEPGDNVVRLITKPYQYLAHDYKNKKINCLKSIGNCPICCDSNIDNHPYVGWLVGVISRKTNTYKILDLEECMMNQIKNYYKNSVWGDPINYDINIQIMANSEEENDFIYDLFHIEKTPLSATDQLIKDSVDLDELQKIVTPTISSKKEYFAQDFDNPISIKEQENIIKDFYKQNPHMKHESEWIQTYTCKKFYPLDPRVEDIDIKDIAHSLSMICRYSGHSSKFYSVAEHSVLVSYFTNPKYGLLHDASEAYISDIAAPIKRMKEFSFYREIEDKLKSIIYKKFGLLEEEPLSLKDADLMLLETEVEELMKPRHPHWKQKFNPIPVNLKCLNPSEAEELFMKRFNEIFV